MNPYRFAGTLMCTGATLGLVGTVPIPWLFYLFLIPAVPAAVAFALVFLFGLLVFRDRRGGRSFGTAGRWFALLGGISSVGITWLAPVEPPFFPATFALGSIAVLSMPLSLTGSAIARVPETERIGAKLIDRDRLSAILVCTGASLGLIGSRASFFGPFALMQLFCFVLVLLPGVLLFRRRPDSRLLAGAVLYFVLISGGVDLMFVFLPLVLYWSVAAWLVLSLVPGLIGAVIAATGAVLRILRARMSAS